MADTTIALTIVAPARFWTTNRERSMHWSERAELAQQWRFTAKLEAMNARLPRFATARIEARVVRVAGRRTDADAFAPVVKACIDGLVDAGVLEDDSPPFVPTITIHAAELGGMADELTLTLRGELAA